MGAAIRFTISAPVLKLNVIEILYFTSILNSVDTLFPL
jgi:hypothetical protein